MASCSLIAQESDDRLVLSTYNVTEGSVVNIGCKKFGQRVIGPINITCLPSGQWSDTTKPKCAWTGELNTYEKLVIGVSTACFVLLLIYIFIIISVVTMRKSRKNNKDREELNDMENPYAINQNVEHAYYNGHGSDTRGSGPYRTRISPNGHISIQEPYPEHRQHNGVDQYYDNKAYEDRERALKTDYRWNGHIPRPRLGPDEGKQPF